MSRLQHLTTSAAGSLSLLALVVLGGLGWAALGGGSRDLLVTQMLINLILVMGLQLFIGNSGILSFGHLSFAAVTGYTVAVLSIPVGRKVAQIPDAPFGIADVELSVGVATLVGVALAAVLGLVVGLAVARVGGIAATMITLALLFGSHAVALNWIELTDGGGGLSFVPRLDGRTWIYAAAAAAVVGARWFRLSRIGRFAQAGREDQLAAAAIGIDARVAWLVAFVLSVIVVAVAAALRVQSLGAISPAFFYFDLTLLTLTMLIVGGRRSVTGALLGTVLITIGNEVTRVLAASGDGGPLGWLLRPGLSDLFLGAAMVGFMLVRPDGLLRDWEFDEWLLARFRRTDAPPADDDAGPPDRPPVTLAARGVTVEFGGFTALSDVSLTARSDEVVGLIGPNGAGKTTLLNVITGMVEPTGGTVTLDGQDLTGAEPHVIARAGLSRTFQNLRLFKELSVAEHVRLAADAARAHRPDAVVPSTRALLEDAGLWESRHRDAGTLDYGSQRKLELARAAAFAPRFLLLDEPTSGMSDTESAAMIDHVRATAARIGAGVVVIDHDLHFITSISDRVVVLDHGEVIAEGPPDVVREDPAVIAAYLGSQAAAEAGLAAAGRDTADAGPGGG